ncbi:hypothetical protein WOLCODRAFT_112303 [Wolfiporia cocos MD-104 SS10]|uniref:Cora-domain-containing protein n=1 Tax=Wolfiporia cocos (strain MD-104) TaxID=742152 RepID=A0A2H3J4L6_WOLCO|nr:hypothetical protein WOLCODRAFT_112303 [Wolfiporia cocos MD-104 SS10]
MTRSQLSRRRKRRKSLADLHNQRSEREIAARIRAREESKIIPRSFELYVPNPDSGATVPSSGTDARERHLLQTDSLPLIISKLGAALRSNGRARQTRSVAALAEQRQPLLHHSYMMPEELQRMPDASLQQERRRARKGKRRAGAPQPPVQSFKSPSSGAEADDAGKAWWLDVSSPTWEDMSAIGKLLHLHPLTLEDILQQDPREKLELFPKLGYYFVVFRAIETQKTRERLRAMRVGSNIDEGIVGEVNVYMVVFREGICSFHFADIGEHVDRVRNKIFKLSQSVHMSSDWIAHGIMDSIVDSFFPYLREVEHEVDDIQTLVVSDSHLERERDSNRSPDTAAPASDAPPPESLEKVVPHMPSEIEEDEKTCTPTSSEKSHGAALKALLQPSRARRTQFTLPASWRLSLRRFRRTFQETFAHFRVVFRHTPIATAGSTVHRMARTRRTVTSLTRFLAHKSEVVAQLQKRLLMVGEWGLGHGTEHDQNVFVYMGDVQDHILTLQQSLAHYERVLSQAHPTYLSHLRVSLSQAQSGTDAALVTLSTVSLGVVCIQTLIGLVSMNVKVPANSLTGSKYDAFGIVILLSVIIAVIYGLFVRLMWVRSKRTRARRRL